MELIQSSQYTIIHDDWYKFHFCTIICVEMNRGVSFLFFFLTQCSQCKSLQCCNCCAFNSLRDAVVLFYQNFFDSQISLYITGKSAKSDLSVSIYIAHQQHYCEEFSAAFITNLPRGNLLRNVTLIKKKVVSDNNNVLVFFFYFLQ